MYYSEQLTKYKTGFVSIPISSGIKNIKEFSNQYIDIDEENKCIILYCSTCDDFF